MGDAFLDLADDDDDGFDQRQCDLAIERSLALASTGLQPRNPPKVPEMAGDDELERALAESMRTFEEEQGGAVVGRKRSSSEDGENPRQQQQQQQQGHSAQQEGPVQQPTSSGPLKRQRSLGALGAELSGQQANARPLTHTPAQALGGARLTRLHGNVVTTALPHQPQQQAPGVLSLLGVQRSASVTNAAAGLRPWPSRGILQPHAQQHQGHGLQQQHIGLGRSASAHDMQTAGHMADADANADADMSDELAGSRPSSPAHINQQGDADDEDDDLPEIHDSDSSMTSIVNESGLPHTRSTWGADLLQAAAAAQQAAPRLVGPAPSAHDPTEWRIHSRQYYVGQAIYWQPYRHQQSYAGRVLSVDGDGSSAHPMLYTAEIHGHYTTSYVEATAEHLQPQLRKGDFVWCKPAAVKAACWSHHGPLFYELHPPSRRRMHDREPVELCVSSPWMRGYVLQTKLWDQRNPIAELRIIGTGGNDCCWFRNSQIELMWEVGESSATAEARAARCAASAQQQQQDEAAAAAAAALFGEQSPGQENEGGTAAQALLLQQQQQQLGGVLQELADGNCGDGLLELAAAGDEADMEMLSMMAMQQEQEQFPHLPEGLVPEGLIEQAKATGQAGLGRAAQAVATAAEAVQAAAAAEAVGEAAVPSAEQPLATPMAAGAGSGPSGPGVASGMSHPVAALTGESELEAAAAASVVDQAAGAHTTHIAVQQPQQQQTHQQPQQQQQPPAAAVKPPQQLQQLVAGGAVVEGTGESAEALAVQEVVADSCPMLSEDGPCGGEGGGPDLSPKEPLSNQHSGVDDDTSTRPRQEGFGET